MHIRVSILLVAAALLAGCEVGTAGLRGRWQKADEQVDFLPDRRMVLTRAGGSVGGRYETAGVRRIQVTFDGTSQPLADWRFQLRGDSLVLCETERPADCARYVRAAPDAPPPFTTRPRAVATPPVPEARALPRTPPPGVDGPAAGPGPTALGPPPSGAWEAEARPVLKQVYALQETYLAENGAYARTFQELERAGWQALPLRHHEPPRIATAERGGLCIDIRPIAEGLRPQHVREGGTIGYGRCP